MSIAAAGSADWAGRQRNFFSDFTFDGGDGGQPYLMTMHSGFPIRAGTRWGVCVWPFYQKQSRNNN